MDSGLSCKRMQIPPCKHLKTKQKLRMAIHKSTNPLSCKRGLNKSMAHSAMESEQGGALLYYR